jgi:hypothetical protein
MHPASTLGLKSEPTLGMQKRRKFPVKIDVKIDLAALIQALLAMLFLLT